MGTNLFSDLLESNTILGAIIDAGMARGFIRQAEEAIGEPGVIGTIGELNVPRK